MDEKRVKYPIGIQDFAGLREEGYLYVDKTHLVYDLVNNNSYMFLARPRRFGKSLLLSTIKYYFEGRKELFEGLKIMQLEKYWKKHPVFMFSFARFEKGEERSMESLIEFHMSQWEREYGLIAGNQSFSNRFAALLRHACESFGQKAVVLIDEYDSAIVSTLKDKNLHEHIKSLLKPLYTVLKDCDMYIQFALITGITRFSKLTIFSGLNNIRDISLDDEYGSICGITEKELETNFSHGISEIAQNYNLDYPQMLETLKRYYDGYHFCGKSEDIYNPFSILNALQSRKIRNYWFVTGIPSFIVDRMRSDDINLEKYLTQPATEETLMTSDIAYTSDIALLFQAGFLTIKEYDHIKNLYRLGIPNREVREGMSQLFLEKYLYPDKLKGQSLLHELVVSIEKGDPDTFLTLLKSFFAGVPFELSKGDKEVYFQNSFYIISNLIGLNIQAERHTSNGSIDLLLTTPNYIYVIEIKLNKKPEIALDQINSKDYALPWNSDGRKVFKIGLSFYSRTRNLGRWIIERQY